MKIPDDTPVEISEGIWNLFGDRSLANGLPLDDNGMELLRRHRQSAERDPRPEWHSQFRFGISGRIFVVFVRTTWWREPRESGLGFLGATARFISPTTRGPGLLTLMCLEDEWEALIGERPEVKPWPQEQLG